MTTGMGCQRVAIATVFIVAAGAFPALAQDAIFDAAGFKQNRDYFSEQPFEHVDTLSGGLVLTFTDLALPGNAGRELRFQRTYNSKTGHWTFGIAGVPIGVLNPDGPPSGLGNTVPADFQMPVLVTADGAEHLTTFTTIAHDEVMTQEFWKYNRVTHVATLGDGTTCFYDASGRLVEIRDTFLNQITIGIDPDQTRHVRQYFGVGQW